MKKIIKNIVLLFLLCVVCGYLALVLVYTLPLERITLHVAESAPVFEEEEGTSRRLLYGNPSSQTDNFTDALMLMTAEYPYASNPFIDALSGNKLTVEKYWPSLLLVSYHAGADLAYETHTYSRYWHGYLTYLKPLLLFLNYDEIREFLIIVQIGTFVAAAALLGYKGKLKAVLPLFLAYFFLSPPTLTHSLQYTPVYMLTMLQMILILLLEEKYRENRSLWLYHFFVTGCLTAYFDLLTYPLVTFGIPMVFLLSEYASDIKEDLKSFIVSGCSWSIGYAAMWGSKWFLGSLTSGQNLFAVVGDAIKTRTGNSSNGYSFSYLDVFRSNLRGNERGIRFILIILALVLLFSIIKNRFQWKKTYWVIVLAALLPFGWYCVLANHSYEHTWFTYRVLSITVYATATLVTYSFWSRPRSRSVLKLFRKKQEK